MRRVTRAPVGWSPMFAQARNVAPRAAQHRGSRARWHGNGQILQNVRASDTIRDWRYAADARGPAVGHVREERSIFQFVLSHWTLGIPEWFDGAGGNRAAMSSTRDATQARDPEMKQTRQGQQRYVGMKVHIGTDTRGVVPSLTTIDVAPADITRPPSLVHGREAACPWRDAYGADGPWPTRPVGCLRPAGVPVTAV
jgi:hypothetical protein